MPKSQSSHGASARGLEKILRLSRWKKIMIVIGVDILVSFASSYLAFALRLGDWQFPSQPLLLYAVVAASILIPVLLWRRIYHSIMRYSGVLAIRDLAMALVFASLPTFLIFGLYGIPGIPRTVSVIQPILLFLALTSSRVFARYLLVDLLRRKQHGEELRRAIIYGAGTTGLQLANSIRQEAGIYLCSFIDDDPRLAGHWLDGVPVMSAGNMEEVLEKFSPTDIFLAMPNLTRRQRQSIIDSLGSYAVRVMTLPNLKQMVDGNISFNDLRTVQIEDLLGRDPVPPNELLMGKNIAGKTVMVTGAGGSIGSELCRQIVFARPAKLVMVEMSEHALYQINEELQRVIAEDRSLDCELVQELGNVSEKSVVKRLMKRWKPETIFHAAAYKHVPLVESNRISGLRNNIFSTLHLAQEAEQCGVGYFILVSTDKAVRPTNVMGASKRACELVLQALQENGSKTKFGMVRFGNVLGSSGSVVPKFQAQIEAGGPITLTHREITRYFMTIPEAAQLVIQAGAMTKGGEVFVLDMGEPIQIFDLARSMIKLSGLSLRSDDNPEGDIEILETGLRPGEKLYEELLIGEDPESTIHPRIMRANEALIPWAELSLMLAEIAGNLDDGDSHQASATLRKIVPEYQPEQAGSFDQITSGSAE